MKNLLYLFLILLLTPGLACAADLERLAASARITAVIVYADRAQTARSASFNFKPGSYLIAFENLPALLQDDSVRVEGKGSAGATIVGLEIKRLFLDKSNEKRIKELDEEIRGLEQRFGALNARKSGLTSQKAFFESIRVAWGERLSKELAIGRPTLTELQDAAGFVAAGVTKVEEQALDIETEKKSLKDKIDALRRQRDESTGSHRKETKNVEVMVEVVRAGSLTMELTLVIPQAGWTPSYDARLAADAKTAELTFRAMVRQQTGEDWNRVDLTLSSARPATGGAPPELSPWHISLYRAQPLMVGGGAMMMAAPVPEAAMVRKAGRMEMKTAQSEDAVVEEAAAYESAQISTEQSSVAFHLPTPLDIPADGAQHGSVVSIAALPVSMEFMAIPKLSPYVFLKSEMINQAAYPLLPGKVNTFSGNTYTGSSQLKKIAAGEKFDLFFGTDDQVTVKREELKQHKEAGIFGKNRVSMRYRIELANFRKESVVVTLRDQLPLAADQEIKVSLEEPSSRPDEIKDDGMLTWKLPLKAGEKKELTFGILVEYPKDREITGL